MKKAYVFAPVCQVAVFSVCLPDRGRHNGFMQTGQELDERFSHGVVVCEREGEVRNGAERQKEVETEQAIGGKYGKRVCRRG